MSCHWLVIDSSIQTGRLKWRNYSFKTYKFHEVRWRIRLKFVLENYLLSLTRLCFLEIFNKWKDISFQNLIFNNPNTNDNILITSEFRTNQLEHVIFRSWYLCYNFHILLGDSRRYPILVQNIALKSFIRIIISIKSSMIENIMRSP